MKKYVVMGTVTISIHTVVEADGEEEARELALDHPMMTLCHMCSSGDETVEWVTSGELDGEANITEIEEDDE